MHGLAAFFASLLSLAQATFSHPSAQALAHSAMAMQQSSARASVIFGGDMLFDRTIRATIEKEGGDFIFSCIDETLASADAVVANLEGPITDNPSTSVGSSVGASDNFVFTFPLATAELLAAHHIGPVNLGNNHIMNFGTAGASSTVAALDAAHVAHFGSPTKHEIAEMTLSGVAFAFINYNEFLGGAGSASTTVEQIQLARLAGQLPVVYTHWGVEYATTSPSSVRQLAHRFVDAGAVLVVGSHPHVVEEHEQYRGVPIYYSLGNFIFDQYFSEAVSHGLLLAVVFNGHGVVSVQEIPIVLQTDRRTCPVR